MMSDFVKWSRVVIASLLVAIAVIGVEDASARKVRSVKKLDAPAEAQSGDADTATLIMIQGEEASRQIELSGYDKPLRSNKESIFITNKRDDAILKSVVLQLMYFDMSGRQIHSARQSINCDIASGSTENVTFPSWDKQNVYYFVDSPRPRSSSATPYKVKIAVVVAMYATNS